RACGPFPRSNPRSRRPWATSFGRWSTSWRCRCCCAAAYAPTRCSVTTMSPGLWHRRHDMRIVISEFISLDGVVQAPGGAEEDTDGGFRHGGWSMPYFDPDVMGSSINEMSERTDALLYGRRTWQVMAGAWPERAG